METPSQDETAETKECPFCLETIKAKAKVCRYCGMAVVPSYSIAKPIEKVKPEFSVFDGMKLGVGMFILLPIVVDVTLLFLVLFWVLFIGNLSGVVEKIMGALAPGH